MTTVSPIARRPVRKFYGLIALATAAIIFLGFAPTFYLRDARAGPLSPLLAVHGAVFTAWLGLFAVQAGLVAAGRTDLHRRLGVAGVVLALAMVGLGVAAAIASLRAGSGPGGLDPRVFAMLPFSSIVLFAGLVAWAVALRHRPEWHKRLMVMATVSLLTPALARIVGAMGMPPPVALALTALAVLVVVAIDGWVHRRLHPAYLWGGILVALSRPLLLFTVAVSPPWLALMDSLKG